MKSFIVMLAVLALTCADVSHLVKSDEALASGDSKYELQPDGNYQYQYETSNGIVAQEAGHLVSDGQSELPHLDVSGAVRYTSPEGVPVELTYTADAFGYHPKGSHLPVQPEIPEAIQRSLAFIAAHPAQ